MALAIPASISPGLGESVRTAFPGQSTRSAGKLEGERDAWPLPERRALHSHSLSPASRPGVLISSKGKESSRTLHMEILTMAFPLPCQPTRSAGKLEGERDARTSLRRFLRWHSLSPASPPIRTASNRAVFVVKFQYQNYSNVLLCKYGRKNKIN